jgi:hypothetical protein
MEADDIHNLRKAVHLRNLPEKFKAEEPIILSRGVPTNFVIV